MEIEKIEENSEIARLIAILIQNTFKNQLLLANLHSPINEISEPYKIMDKGEIIAGFAIYKGYEIPVVPFPFSQTEVWPKIRNFIDTLDFEQVLLPFPSGLEGNPSISPPPHLGWNTYQWVTTETNYAMRLTKKEIEVMSIDHLPEIRAAKPEDANQIQSLLAKHKMDRWFHPIQLWSELAVIAEEDKKIIGFAGTHFETPYTVQIGNVAVEPTYREKELETALLTAVILGILRTRRVPTVFVNEQNKRAIKFYERVGFESYDRFNFVIGRRKI